MKRPKSLFWKILASAIVDLFRSNKKQLSYYLTNLEKTFVSRIKSWENSKVYKRLVSFNNWVQRSKKGVFSIWRLKALWCIVLRLIGTWSRVDMKSAYFRSINQSIATNWRNRKKMYWLALCEKGGGLKGYVVLKLCNLHSRYAYIFPILS